jgi:hypothetical protein
MTSRARSAPLFFLSLIIAFVFGSGAFAVIGGFDLMPFGTKSSSEDSQVVQAIQRTQEVSLLSLGIQGLMNEKKCSEVFGKCIPGSSETVFLQYNFDAKLGIDGSDVQVRKNGVNGFSVSIPRFSFIGYDRPTFKVATQSGGVLRFVTQDIDRVEMINRILDDNAQDKYIQSNDQVLKDQTKAFYESLIRSVDSDAKITFTFRP